MKERADRVNVAHHAIESVQVAPVSWRDDPVVRAMVSSVAVIASPARQPFLLGAKRKSDTGAVDSSGQTIEFLLADRRDAAAAKRFFRRAIAERQPMPRVITVDKNPAYPRAVIDLK